MFNIDIILQLFLLSAILLSSVSWHILIKGVGNVDNLWTFFLIITMVFFLSSSIISYFPFVTPHFFIATMVFTNISTLYIYSFPRSRWPHSVWLAVIAILDLGAVFLFLRFPEAKYFSYFFMGTGAIVVNFIVAFRKIKYLKSHRLSTILSYISFIGAISFVIPVSSGFSILYYNASYLLISIYIIIPATLILLGVITFSNMNSSTGLTHVSYALMFVFSLPISALTRGLLEFRAAVSGVIETVNYSLGASIILFIILCLDGSFISIASTAIEGFIYRNRTYYQKFINQYKVKIEDITTHREIFSFFTEFVLLYFSEIKDYKLLVFNDDFADSINFNCEVIDNALLTEFSGAGVFQQEPYFSKASVDLVPEISSIFNEYGGDFIIPVIYRTELNGFVVLSGRKLAHNAVMCLVSLIEMSLNQYEKTALFNSILETEKKLEASRHFQETGKMVSFIAHELRSPLSSILFNMEVIKDSIKKEKEIDGEYLDISLKEVKRLNETVEKMLTYGRNIKLSISEGTFAEFFQEIEHIFFNDSRSIDFENQTGSRKFKLDWDALKSIFINVINNSLQAIERSGKDGSVTVTVKKTRTRLIITISDSGPGIPEEHRASIFEPFYTTRKEGNGLGLATCEKIAKLSGGTIKIKETSSKGTTFEIILPVTT